MTPFLGPDEYAYDARARLVSEVGPVAGPRRACREFLSDPSAHAYPPPTRWLWAWVGALTRRCRFPAASLASIAFCAALGGFIAGAPGAVLVSLASPLLLTLGRRWLQDAPVAAMVLGCLVLARGDLPYALALCAAALLCTREGGLLSFPAVLAVNPGFPTAAALCAGVVGWAAATRAVCGPQWLDVVRASAAGQRHPYTLAYQQGAPHRLLVDLVACSPGPVLLAVSGRGDPHLFAAVALLIGFHACSPVRNVRTVLAADVVVRSLTWPAMVAAGWPVVAMCFACDLLVAWRIRRVYDPVTSELTRALGMAP